MIAPPEVLTAAKSWGFLTRWERAELGRGLRRAGWTYGEIMEVLPVGKGTLAGWCKEIRLSDEQIDAIKARVPSRKDVPTDTNWKRRLEIKRIRADARLEVPTLIKDPCWVAGTVLYWAEGAKTTPRLGMVNTDPRTLRLFIRWIRLFQDRDAVFVLALHLHAGNDDESARQWWRQALSLPDAHFYKTFVKPPGTGHRKNKYTYGVCRVEMRRSANAYHRTMEWIDCIALEVCDSPMDTLNRSGR